MKEITEDLIERFVGFPETLDEELRERVAAAVRADRAAREVADFYREYYRGLRGEDVDEGGSDDPPSGDDWDHPSIPPANGSSRAASSPRDACA